MSPILEYNYEEAECTDSSTATITSGKHNNSVIMLQPSFPLLQHQAHQSVSSLVGVGEGPLPSSSEYPKLKLSSIEPNEIWHMWSVATKAKTSIPQGYRLENLSWRLWHRYVSNSTTHAIHANANRTNHASTSNLIGPPDLLNQTNQAPETSSSRTSVNLGVSSYCRSPDSLTPGSELGQAFNPSIGLLNTASTILSEIQQNSSINSTNNTKNASVLSPSPPQSETTPFYPKKESGTTIISSSSSASLSPSSSQQQHHSAQQEQQSETKSETSGTEMGSSSTATKASGGKGGRRKKNVQRFMQRYQNRLADISERITQSEASESEDFCPGSSERETPITTNASKKGSTGPIDVKRGDSPVLQASKPSKAHSDDTYFKKAAEEMKRVSPANSDPQKPKISLLTRLLDHNHKEMHRPSGEDSFNPMSELRFRRESGTPLGQTPPARPSAPVIFSDATSTYEETNTNDGEGNHEKPSIRRSIGMAKKGNNALLDNEQRRMSMDSNEGDFTSMMLW